MATDPTPMPSGARLPSDTTRLPGRYVVLELLARHHIPDLWSSLGLDGDASILSWLPWTKPNNEEELWMLFEKLRRDRGFIIYAIIGDPTRVNAAPNQGVGGTSHRKALGTIGYLEVNIQHRTIETGAVLFGSALRRSAAATEAHYLLLCNVCEATDSLPYRRIAWKNNSLNTASRRAAERIGYRYEGTWRNHMLQNEQSRDTDWLSIIDVEWAQIKLALETWLDDKNFNEKGEQVQTLEQIRSILASMQAGH